ncbi:MAG TPA: glyoxalase [Thiotrichales bacterium]|nr:glyoxalase [Thiotrichales bacterium]
MIAGIHHCSLLVEDLERSLAFYCGVLGMAQDAARPDLGYAGAWLLAGNQQLHLLRLPSPDPVAGRPAHGGRDRHVALVVDSVERLRERLEAAGIPFTASRSGRPALFCRDPDGNALEFVEIAIAVGSGSLSPDRSVRCGSKSRS